jgi:hypothetical protein
MGSDLLRGSGGLDLDGSPRSVQQKSVYANSETGYRLASSPDLLRILTKHPALISRCRIICHMLSLGTLHVNHTVPLILSQLAIAKADLADLNLDTASA